MTLSDVVPSIGRHTFHSTSERVGRSRLGRSLEGSDHCTQGPRPRTPKLLCSQIPGGLRAYRKSVDRPRVTHRLTGFTPFRARKAGRAERIDAHGWLHLGRYAGYTVRSAKRMMRDRTNWEERALKRAQGGLKPPKLLKDVPQGAVLDAVPPSVVCLLRLRRPLEQLVAEMCFPASHFSLRLETCDEARSS